MNDTNETNPTGREPGHAHEAEVEAMARAIYERHRIEGSYDRWSIASPIAQDECRRNARAVLAAAMPLMRERLAQEVEASPIRTISSEHQRRTDARIVRGATS